MAKSFEPRHPITSCAGPVWRYVVSMDWQQLVSLAIVASAAALLLGSRFRRRKFCFEREPHCGCAERLGFYRPGSIVFRTRKGERPEVRLRTR